MDVHSNERNKAVLFCHDIKSMTTQHFCYILSNPKWPGKTYAGYTVCPARRLRQHNGGLKGGAKYTARFKPDWEFVCLITSPQFTKNTGLSFEWSLHHPTNRRARPKDFNGIDGRMRSLQVVFNNKKFRDYEYTIYVHPLHHERMRELLKDFNNISVNELSSILKEQVMVEEKSVIQTKSLE